MRFFVCQAFVIVQNVLCLFKFLVRDNHHEHASIFSPRFQATRDVIQYSSDMKTAVGMVALKSFEPRFTHRRRHDLPFPTTSGFCCVLRTLPAPHFSSRLFLCTRSLTTSPPFDNFRARLDDVKPTGQLHRLLHAPVAINPADSAHDADVVGPNM